MRMQPEIGPEVDEEKPPLPTKLTTMSKTGARNTPSTTLNDKSTSGDPTLGGCADTDPGTTFGYAMGVVSWICTLYHAMLGGRDRLLALLRGLFTRAPQRQRADAPIGNARPARLRTRKHKAKSLTALKDTATKTRSC